MIEWHSYRAGGVSHRWVAARWIATVLCTSGLCLAASAALAAPHVEVCPRPPAGSVVPEPRDLRSQDGSLTLDLVVRNQSQPDGTVRYCYLLADGSQSPTLRLNAGDELVLNFKNQLNDPDGEAAGVFTHHHDGKSGSDACTSGKMSPTSANLHFHGLTVRPVCHQDDVLHTSIQPNDPSFQYRFRIPKDEPPGLYWYHPHIHGFSSRQVLGGASGAMIVEGIERAVPEVAGMSERVLIIRDQDLINPDAGPSASESATRALIDRDGDAINTGTGAGKPAKDLSVNFVPVPYPDYPPAVLQIRPGERQLWRLLNASSVTYLNVAALVKRGAKYRAQFIGVVAIDGAPIGGGGSPGHSVEWRDAVVIPPGGRVEFIMVGPPAGVPAMLVTRSVNTGHGGENDPNRVLASVVGAVDAPTPRSTLPKISMPLVAAGGAWLGDVEPVRTRRLYFSETLENTDDPNGPTSFFLTVEGQKEAKYDPASTEPNIIVKQGDVEDWIIENRTAELHAFHIHQLHFDVLEWGGVVVNEPFLRDTVNIPFYSTQMRGFPGVRLRMDFRSPNAVGTFVYHCHLLDHEDGGMMGVIRVEPAEPKKTPP
jgi:FtsP/CotA-like multicopper oxidase with cupredoxin domain